MWQASSSVASVAVACARPPEPPAVEVRPDPAAAELAADAGEHRGTPAMLRDHGGWVFSDGAAGHRCDPCDVIPVMELRDLSKGTKADLARALDGVSSCYFDHLDAGVRFQIDLSIVLSPNDAAPCEVVAKPLTADPTVGEIANCIAHHLRRRPFAAPVPVRPVRPVSGCVEVRFVLRSGP